MKKYTIRHKVTMKGIKCIMTYEEARLFIDEADKKGIVLGLENTRELLKRLRNPQDKLKFVHIAGTNGKGSVLAYISTVLKEAGYIVGRYVSPTIFSYRERIQVNEEMISREDLAKYIGIVKIIIEQMIKEGLPYPTAFEIETAVSFLYFRDKKCEIVILETGLGGDEDSTNVINSTICSVIMSISYDHTRILGNTIEEIARHKAGIIKKGVPVVLYKDNIKNDSIDFPRNIETDNKRKDNIKVKFNNKLKDILELETRLEDSRTDIDNDKIIEKVIKKRCEELDSELILSKPHLIRRINKDYSFQSNNYIEKDFIKSGKNIGFLQQFSYGKHKNLSIPLLGEFQLYNVAAAIEAIDVLKKQGYKISENSLRKGLERTVWHSRLEIIGNKPLVVIDGAHNPDAALKLRESIELYFTNKQKIYIMGVLSDKDYRKIIKFTVDLSDIIYTITPNNSRALKAEDLKCVIKDEFPQKKVIAATSIDEAIRETFKIADENSVIIAFGSLSYLGEFKKIVNDYMK